VTEKRPGPYFTGINTYRDPNGRFSVRYPTDWQPFELEGREGMMFVPNPDDMQTALAIWAAPLEHPAVAEDLRELRAGVDEGLRALAECHVESETDEALDNLIRFERVYTFREDGAIRKRKLWLLYASTWQIVLLWQASSLEEYDYWFAMANYSFLTFDLPQALLFATDRGLVGQRPGEER
jgi:hypothetical protein